MFGRTKNDTASVVRFLAEQVRRDISFGVLAPDTKLKIEELRQRYGGSAHSFREALTLLAADGIVEANAQRGFRVASATQADLEDIARLRAEIECLGLRWSMKHGDVAWEGVLVAANHTLARAEQNLSSDPDPMRWNGTRQGARFTPRWSRRAGHHDPSMQARLYDQSRRFRLAEPGRRPDRPRASRASHNAIVAAALEGNCDSAVAALQRDILELAAKVGDGRKNWPARGRPRTQSHITMGGTT
ncbi:MAG: GntR family transcriptional regulator [Rhizobiaceae bacterium]|nr:GntR family transcriptional regulator [Rhizobiaceae bacterium]